MQGAIFIGWNKYQLLFNNKEYSLIGGFKDFDKRVWKGTTFTKVREVGIVLTYLSPDGKEVYQGNLSKSATYTLGSEKNLRIDYEATTDQPTIINFTNHSYFNLKDWGTSNVLNHELKINAFFIPLLMKD